MAAPAFRSKTDASGGPITSLSVTTPAGVTTDDVMILVVCSWSSPVHTVTTPSGWTLQYAEPVAASPYELYKYNVYWRRAGASEPGSFNIVLSQSGYIDAVCVAYSGVNTTTAVDVFTHTSNPSTQSTFDAPTATTTVADTRVVCGLIAQNDFPYTPPTGMTERSDFNFATLHVVVTVADVAQAAAGATGAKTFTWTGGSDAALWFTFTLALRPAAAAVAPVADFTATPLSGAATLAVTFTDTSTNTPTSWAWTFGDTGTSTSQNPSHNYTSPGVYTVTLTATNAAGSDGETKTGYITVGETIVYATGGGIDIY